MSEQIETKEQPRMMHLDLDIEESIVMGGWRAAQKNRQAFGQQQMQSPVEWIRDVIHQAAIDAHMIRRR